MGREKIVLIVVSITLLAISSVVTLLLCNKGVVFANYVSAINDLLSHT